MANLFSSKKKTRKTNKPRQSLFVSSCAFVSESWCLYSHSVSDYTYAFTRIISTQAVQVWPWPQTSLFLLHLIYSSLSLLLTPASASRLTELSAIMYACERTRLQRDYWPHTSVKRDSWLWKHSLQRCKHNTEVKMNAFWGSQPASVCHI